MFCNYLGNFRICNVWKHPPANKSLRCSSSENNLCQGVCYLQRENQTPQFTPLLWLYTREFNKYANKFTKLSRFVPEFVSSKRLKMRRFEEGLAFYIRNQLVGQPILTCQELYERAAEVKRVKMELRTLNPTNQKRKRIEQGAPSESVNQKKPPLLPRAILQALQSPIGSAAEPITPLLNAALAPTNACGVELLNTSSLHAPND